MIFDFFDKRMRFLKKEKHEHAARAIELYAGEGKHSFCYFCGATGSDESDWEAFKLWICNWVVAGQLDDDGLKQVYLRWAESENHMSENTASIIDEYWKNGGPIAFNKKEDVSGMFFIFAAFAEYVTLNKT